MDDRLPAWLKDYLFGGGASAARTILDAIASSLITVTALTFSLTVVTLQLASSQFSPRLLRTFTRDLFVQSTLALFLATFTFARTVLRSVRSADEDREVFVPQMSVTAAFLLALASVMALVLFLAHLAREIRVDSLLRAVPAEASSTADRLVAALRGDGAEPVPAVPARPASAIRLVAAGSGFVVGLDHVRLLETARRTDAVIVLDCSAGAALVAGTPIGWAWPLRAEGPLATDAAAELREGVRAAIRTGFERTPSEDLGLGLRQLTDVAVKALSPGINDPTTAVDALNHCAVFLCELDPDDLGLWAHRDDDGRARVVFPLPSYAALLDLALDQPRRYGGNDPEVLLAVLALLRAVAWRRPAAAAHVRSQLERTREVIADAAVDSAVRDRLHAALLEVELPLSAA